MASWVDADHLAGIIDVGAAAAGPAERAEVVDIAGGRVSQSHSDDRGQCDGAQRRDTK